MDIIFQNIDKLITLGLMITMSISVRLVLQVLGQRWITTTAHTSTLVLLPLLTYVITNVITGNIALSLGMVGALSIVRFRHPVRSPFELSVYFGAITMGIAATVSLSWLLFLAVSIILATITLLFFHYISLNLFGKPFFIASFSEGNALSTLDILTSKHDSLLDKSQYLMLKRVSKENFQYILNAKRFEDLLILQESFKDDENIISYQLNK